MGPSRVPYVILAPLQQLAIGLSNRRVGTFGRQERFFKQPGTSIRPGYWWLHSVRPNTIVSVSYVGRAGVRRWAQGWLCHISRFDNRSRRDRWFFCVRKRTLPERFQQFELFTVPGTF